jgi:hypothetical protein
MLWAAMGMEPALHLPHPETWPVACSTGRLFFNPRMLTEPRARAVLPLALVYVEVSEAWPIALPPELGPFFLQWR